MLYQQNETLSYDFITGLHQNFSWRTRKEPKVLELVPEILIYLFISANYLSHDQDMTVALFSAILTAINVAHAKANWKRLMELKCSKMFSKALNKK